MKERLLVRCCCQPTKILGSLPRPANAHEGLQVGFRIGSLAAMGAPVNAEVVLPIGTMCTRGFFGGEVLERELAFKSEETPIETLRRIPEFEEWSDAQRAEHEEAYFNRAFARNRLVRNGVTARD